jgi:hypothetical protein
MTKKGMKKEDILYYNRKFVHIFAGGIVALFIPFYHSAWYPLLAGLLLTTMTYISHKKGNSLYWFQTSKDHNDVNFCLMWGVSIFILWNLIQNPWIAILPATFMAFGDGITGIVRNAIFKRRFKHPVGNLFMGIVCIFLGYVLGGTAGIPLGGILAGILASFIERFEFGPIDDNVLITLVSSTFLYGYFLAANTFSLPF